MRLAAGAQGRARTCPRVGERLAELLQQGQQRRQVLRGRLRRLSAGLARSRPGNRLVRCGCACSAESAGWRYIVIIGSSIGMAAGVRREVSCRCGGASRRSCRLCAQWRHEQSVSRVTRRAVDSNRSVQHQPWRPPVSSATNALPRRHRPPRPGLQSKARRLLCCRNRARCTAHQPRSLPTSGRVHAL